MRRRELLAALPVAGAGVGAGCTIGGEPPEPDDLTLSAPAFEDGRIPERYTCDGAGVSPPLRASGAPEGTAALAVVGEWLYSYTPGTIWLLWNLPPEDPLELPAGLPAERRLEDPDAVQGRNDEDTLGYRPPCHETPDDDEYRFALLALESPLELEPGAYRDDFDDAVEGEVRSSTSLTATYDRL